MGVCARKADFRSNIPFYGWQGWSFLTFLAIIVLIGVIYNNYLRVSHDILIYRIISFLYLLSALPFLFCTIL